ncbi:hypothetical protein C2845_PM09G12980 [Panicum miliaceum]|uniref:Glycosyl-hydrolase family 116 N-terminal domain-containing protein n=1 Tax=Panicum miliaceum TaxID=4540 RepID=A0A3L6RYV8_PANMI|nr:hypothetical protein C2845_PM09G12980 [Panicum miliaceum]
MAEEANLELESFGYDEHDHGDMEASPMVQGRPSKAMVDALAVFGKAPIDPFIKERCRPSASQGVSLGGMRSGSISRDFRGEFKNWHMIPGLCESAPVHGEQMCVGYHFTSACYLYSDAPKLFRLIVLGPEALIQSSAQLLKYISAIVFVIRL